MTRTAEEEYQEDCILPKFHKLDTIMIWGSICGSIKGPMVIWDKDQWGKSINGTSYCDHIITPHLYPFWCHLSSEWLDYIYLQQDGAPAHRAKVTTTLLTDLNIFGYFFKWPASSPDLNPIEHVWRLMKDRIHRRSPRPTTNILLRQAIQEEWDAITSEEIASLIASMPSRVEAVQAVAGGHTRY